MGFINASNVWLSVGLQAASLIVLLVGVISFANFKSPSARNVFHIGKGTEAIPINVFGVDVNSWFRYGCLMGWIVLSEALGTYAWKVYKNWYRNKLLDPKSKDVMMSDPAALTLVNVWSVLTFIPQMFKWLLLIVTAQVQFSHSWMDHPAHNQHGHRLQIS